MPPSDKPTTYAWEEGVLLQALTSPKGLRLRTKGGTKKEATYLVARLNLCRAAQQKLSLKLFEEDDPRRGKSAYDSLTIRRVHAPRDNVNPTDENWIVEILNTEAKAAQVTIEEL